MAHDKNLINVDPHLRDEASLRIQVLMAFVANPGTAKARIAAKELGMSVSAFYDLVRAWKANKEAAQLPGIRKKVRPRDLSVSQIRLLVSCNRAAPDASIASIIALAEEKAHGTTHAFSNKRAMREHIRHLRIGTAPLTVRDHDIYIDHCQINIPIAKSSGGNKRGTLTLVLKVGSNQILGSKLFMGPPTAENTAIALARAVEAFPGLALTKPLLLMDRPATGDWRKIVELVSDAGWQVSGAEFDGNVFDHDSGPIRRRGNGRGLLAMLGREVAGFKIRARTCKSQDDLPATLRSNAVPLPLLEADELVCERVMGSRKCSRTEKSDTTAKLVDTLRRIGAGQRYSS